MDISEIYELTLQALREMYSFRRDGRIDEGQFRQNLNAAGVITKVALRARDAGLWEPSQPISDRTPDQARHLFPAEDSTSVRGVLWQFVGMGILFPRAVQDEDNTSFVLTRYGERVLEEEHLELAIRVASRDKVAQ